MSEDECKQIIIKSIDQNGQHVSGSESDKLINLKLTSKDLNNNINNELVHSCLKPMSVYIDDQIYKQTDLGKNTKPQGYESSYVEAFSLDLEDRDNVFFSPDEPIYVQITGHDEEPSLVVLHTNVYTIHVRYGRYSWTIKRKYKQFLKLYEAYALFKTKLNLKSVTLPGYSVQHTTPGVTIPANSRENSKFKPSDHFKLIFQTIASDFNQAKNILEKFLQEVVDHKVFRNHNETLKFLEVSHLSFIADLGDKNKEGVVKKRSFNIGCCYPGIKLHFFWQSRWLVIKDTWIAYLNPQTGLLKSVILVDQGFKVKTGPNGTGTRKGLLIENYSKSLIVKCHNEKRAHEWRMAVLQMLFTTGQKFLSAQRFGSFAPIREDSACKWFVDGCDYMSSIADSIDAAKEEIFITGFFLSPEIYLKRPMMVGDKWRLDKLLKRKAEEGVKIYVLIYKEIEMTLPNNSAYSKRVLALSHKNIKVLRHPDRINEKNKFSAIMWAHHEKLVIVDQSVAYFGGIDLAFGRWDNHLHKLTDLGSVLPPKIPMSQTRFNNQKTTSEENFDMLHCEDRLGAKSDLQSVRLINFKLIKDSDMETTTNGETSALLKSVVIDKPNDNQTIQDDAASASRRLKAVRMMSSPSCSLDIHEHPIMMKRSSLGNQSTVEDRENCVKQSRLDRFFKNGLMRSKSLEAVDLTGDELLNELQFPVSNLHQPSYNRLRSIKESINNRLNRSKSQTVKIPNRREYAELTIFNKLKKIQLKIIKSIKRTKADETEPDAEETSHEDKANQSFDLSLSEHTTLDLQGSSKYWIGKDYCNFIYKDVKEVSSPFKDSIDRTRVPRMPWHDVGGCVCGPAARDIARHFIQRWNYVKTKKFHKNKNYPLLVPKSYKAAFLYPPGLISKCTNGCRVQVVRSVCAWSSGQSKTESSIHAAMRHMITNAQSYIYIENQFFVSLIDDSSVQNGIAQCLFDRIVQASKQKTPFKCYILVPLIPGYEGEYGRSSGVLLHAITHYNNASINGLIKRLTDEGVDALNYICFFSLRTWAELNNKPITELIYVHSKLMIVDDRACLIGSANINDRSLLGSRDSEVALLIEDTQFCPGILNKRPVQVGKFCSSLRQRLFKELLGEFGLNSSSTHHTHVSTSSSSSLNSASVSTSISPTHSLACTRRARLGSILNDSAPSDVNGVHLDITDPCSDDFYKKVLLKYASQNTKIYDKVFNVIPSNYVNKFQQLKEYQKAISLSQSDPNEARNELAKVKGYIVLYPNWFLCFEDLKPPLGTKEKLMPNIIWT